MAHPGFFFIDTGDVIREKDFETKIRQPIHPKQCDWKAFLN